MHNEQILDQLDKLLTEQQAIDRNHRSGVFPWPLTPDGLVLTQALERERVGLLRQLV